MATRISPLTPARSLVIFACLGTLLALTTGCAAQSAADGTPPVPSNAVPGAPGLPNPSATDPSPRGYGPTSTSGVAAPAGEFRR